MSATAGYSGTPLAAKLGLKAGMRTVWLDAPDHLGGLLGPLEGVVVGTRLGGHPDAVLCFVTRRTMLRRRATALRRAATPDGMIWVCWPKRASGVASDVTEDIVRELLLPTGLVDVKVCAVDETWSGLKLVVRRELR